jgi:hypothetical protein
MQRAFLTYLGNVTSINYLAKARTDRLKLIDGDSEEIANMLGLIDEYEGKSHLHLYAIKYLTKKVF